eukprot:c7854_g1_i3.p1 GENE.c7854_g1_i3~~c7854_g1_i3.p1  ORF type:complete len:166 (+),score=13.90 c7854_g1_i3:39-536(+)
MLVVLFLLLEPSFAVAERVNEQALLTQITLNKDAFVNAVLTPRTISCLLIGPTLLATFLSALLYWCAIRVRLGKRSQAQQTYMQAHPPPEDTDELVPKYSQLPGPLRIFDFISKPKHTFKLVMSVSLSALVAASYGCGTSNGANMALSFILPFVFHLLINWLASI